MWEETPFAIPSPTQASHRHAHAMPSIHFWLRGRATPELSIDRMPQQPSRGPSPNTAIALLLLLFVAFFPGLFHSIWTLPFRLLPVFRSPSQGYTGTGRMTWFQKQFTLPAKSRGSYLITDQVVGALPEIRDYKVGLLNLFAQHTSCALSLNENCEPKPRACSMPPSPAFSWKWIFIKDL